MKHKIGEINQLKVASLLTYVNIIISCIIPLFYTPIMLDILGQNEYGLYSLSNSVVGYLSLLTFGMGNTVIRYVIKCRTENDYDKLERVAGMFVLIYLMLAGLVLLVGFQLPRFSGNVFGKGLSAYEISRLNCLIIIMTASTAISFVVSVFSAIAIAFEKYLFRKSVDCIGTIMAPILNLIVLFAGYATIGMAFAALGAQVAYLLVFISYCIKGLNIRPRFQNMPFEMMKEILGFSIIIFISSVVDMLYWATDKILIGAMLGTAAVAVYNIGGTFTGMLQNLASGVSGVFGTRVTTMVFKNQPMEEVTELMIRIGRLQYLIISFCLSGYIVFGQAFIHYWAGDSYANAFYIGLMTMIPLVIPLIQSIALTTVVAQNKHRFRAILYAVIAIGNVVATYFVIPYFGILGAAACTAIAFLIGNGLIMNIYYYKVTGLNIPLFWRNILKISIVPIGLSIVAGIIIKLWAPVYSITVFLVDIIIYTCVFGVLTWKISMNSYEKDLFKDLIKKILPDKILKRRK